MVNIKPKKIKSLAPPVTINPEYTPKVTIPFNDFFQYLFKPKQIGLTSLGRNSVWSCRQVILGDPFLKKN